MFLSDIAIRRPVFTTMLSLALVFFGILSYRTLPVDQFPPVEFPILLVQTVWPGAAPEDVERDVTKPLEDAVASAAGIDQIQSFTRDSVSLLVMRFELGADLQDAVATVRDKVSVAQRALPQGVDAPVIRPIDLGALPVMVMAFAAPGGVNVTRQLADDRLRPFLEQVQGVGSVNVLGGQRREVQVDLDLDALRSLGISAQQVADRIGWENLSLPAGDVDRHGFSVGVRTEGQLTSVRDLEQIAVHVTPDGRQVRLGEVARVTDGHEEAGRYVRVNGKDAVSLEVIKRSGANTVEVAHLVREALEQVVPTLGEGVTYEIIVDTSHDVEANAEEVTTAIWFGGLMAVGVILLFLLDVRGTIISSLALPTSVVGTFAVMAWMGFSLNTMTLLALSLAIGLLIDDAVVVRESITRRLEAGDDPVTAASRGTREIALAVVATTFSLVAVFVPVSFMSGIVGQFFWQFGITISVAVLLSLFVAFTLDPMLSSRFSVRIEHGHRRGVAGFLERRLDWIDRSYRGILDWVLRWRVTTMALAFLTLAFTICVGAFLPSEFVPKEDRSEFFADLRLPIGTSLETSDRMARDIEARLLAITGVARVYTIVGHEDLAHRTRFRVGLPPLTERDTPASAFQVKVREILEAVPSAEVNITEPGMIDGLGDWQPLMFVLTSESKDLLQQEADRAKALLQAVPGTRDVRLSLSPGRPELHIAIDRMLAADRMVPSGLVASTARLLLEGTVVGSMRDGGPEADIRVRADARFGMDESLIAALPLPSPRGLVTLGDVAHVTMAAGPSEIQRTNRLRSIMITGELDPTATLGPVLTEFLGALDKAPLQEGVYFDLEGQAADMEETSAAMGLAVSIALVCIYMVLASQFESLLHPFTLLLSVPMAMVGAVLALAVTGNSISMGSQIGMILLMGLVTKNAILLVDGALVGLREGLDPAAAMKEAGPRRLRPILMTSAAMAMGMMPTAINTGIGAGFRAPMAIAVIGGVISSTLLTLLVVPVAFVWMEWVRRAPGRVWAFVFRRNTAPEVMPDLTFEEAAK